MTMKLGMIGLDTSHCMSFAKLLNEPENQFHIPGTKIVMGKGCKSVQAFNTEKIDVIVGLWEDGRIGTLRGNRTGANNFGCVITTGKSTKTGVVSGEIPYYALMLKKVIPFFQNGISPIDLSESLEVIAFLEAASKSRANSGKRVKIRI
jgi:hypothetical protein